MKCTMMACPLLLSSMLDRAGKLYPNVEIVSALPDGSLHRYTYKELHLRARKLASALQQAGIARGDRIATLMWNGYAHLEAYFAVPMAGAVVHTLNLRLHADELVYIINHAQDRFLIVDDVLLEIFQQFRARVNLERVFVVHHGPGELPHGCEDYETFVKQGSGELNSLVPDEHDAAAMCYTSGTTGTPKGVVYSHRALALHSLAISLPDQLSFSCRDTVLPAMSMFHANAWGFPYAATMNGSKQVLPGRNLQAEALLNLFQGEEVTLTGGVPTVWLPVVELLERHPGRWKLAAGLRVVVAGSAAPESLFRRFDKLGVRVIQPWGMTETTPLATVSVLKPHMEAWTEDERYAVRAKQGVPLPFIEVRAIAAAAEAPWDGETAGELQVRGPWVAATYHCLDQDDKWTADGWLCTGDVVTIDGEGYIKITDRLKDLIKSGGEWISSVDLENALVGHEAVKEAAVIAVPHPKWQERPLAVVVPKDGAGIGAPELRAYLERRFARWQVPDAFIFVSQLPHTSTGKLLKSKLRQEFKDWKWEESLPIPQGM